MTEVFISGHGAYGREWPLVPVPPGRSVVFYSDFDTRSLAQLSAAVLSAGDVAPRQEYSAGMEMPNYFLTPLNSSQMAGELAMVSSRLPGRLYLVGVDVPGIDLPADRDEVSMCTLPDVCGHRNRNPSWDHHPRCRGLLAVFDRGTRVHVLACRGQLAGPDVSTLELDAYSTVHPETGQLVHTSLYGESPTSYIEDLGGKLMDVFYQGSRDPQEAMAYVESLPQASLAALRTFFEFTAWLEVMHHPLTADSSQTEIDELAGVIRSFPRYSNRGRGFWRALPEITRQELARRGGEAVTAFLESTGELVATASSPVSLLPDDFFAAWADIHWRNAFWRWLADNPPENVNADQLIDLYRRLDEFPADMMFRTRGDLAVLEDLDSLFSHRWNNPPGQLAALAVVLHELLAEISAPTRLDPTHPAVESYLLEYRRTQAGAAFADDYAELAPDQQVELTAWVYDRPGDSSSLEQLPDIAQDQSAELLTQMGAAVRTLLDDLYASYRNTFVQRT
ncbi:MAG: hypothetical protein H0T78_04855 [Longispora sp.]|nr:hypothetical protein [Longispora sp. (in: high G+C Gram-positive bacteria)]